MRTEIVVQFLKIISQNNKNLKKLFHCDNIISKSKLDKLINSKTPIKPKSGSFYIVDYDCIDEWKSIDGNDYSDIDYDKHSMNLLKKNGYLSSDKT